MRDDPRRLQRLAARGDRDAITALVRHCVRRGVVDTLRGAGLETHTLEALCVRSRQRLPGRCLTSVLMRSLDALSNWHDEGVGHGGIDAGSLHLVVAGRMLRAVVIEHRDPTEAASPARDLRDLARVLIQAHLGVEAQALDDDAVRVVIGWNGPLNAWHHSAVQAPMALEQLVRRTHRELFDWSERAPRPLRDARQALAELFGESG